MSDRDENARIRPGDRLLPSWSGSLYICRDRHDAPSSAATGPAVTAYSLDGYPVRSFGSFRAAQMWAATKPGTDDKGWTDERPAPGWTHQEPPSDHQDDEGESDNREEQAEYRRITGG